MPPPEAPQVTVAKIGAEVERQKLVASQTSEQQTVAFEERLAAAADALEGNKLNVESTVALHELETKRQMALLDYANRQRISLDAAKAQLAKTAMTLEAQARLNAADNALEMRKNGQRPSRGARPPVQLPGRASNGNSFEQTGPVQ